MTEQAFDREAALRRYVEIMESDVHTLLNSKEDIEKLEIQAGVEGFRFVDNGDSWSIEPMSDFDRSQFAHWHTSEQTTENTEVFLWHVNVELPGTKLEKKQYHIAIVDGEKKIDVIVNYGPGILLTIEPYLHHEMNYTVHDSCDHEADYCVLDDPRTYEFQDAAMEAKYHWQVTQKIMGAKEV